MELRNIQTGRIDPLKIPRVAVIKTVIREAVPRPIASFTSSSAVSGSAYADIGTNSSVPGRTPFTQMSILIRSSWSINSG